MFITEALYLRENQRRRGDVYCLQKMWLLYREN